MSFYSVAEKWTNLFCDCGFCRVENLFQLIFHWKNSCTFLKNKERWKYGTSASPRGIVSRLWTMRSIAAWAENNGTEILPLLCNTPCFQFDSVHVNLKEENCTSERWGGGGLFRVWVQCFCSVSAIRFFTNSCWCFVSVVSINGRSNISLLYKFIALH